MAEFELDGVMYQLAKLDAMTQFHISRRIMPLMGALGGAGKKKADGMARLFEAVGRLSDEDTEYVIGKCLAGCVKKDGGAKVYVNGRLMFEDIGMMGMLRLTMETLKENLTDFFTGLGSPSLPAGS